MEARLLLEDGTLFTGNAFGGRGETVGSIVFNTGMTGYQEVLSDASHYGQIVAMTYPSIGNYGIARDEFESVAPTIHGLVVRRYEPTPSNWKACYSLERLMEEFGIPGISGIDTRMLTRHIRNHGSMKALLTTSQQPVAALAEQLAAAPLMNDQVSRISTQAVYTLPGKAERIVVIDFGVKQTLLRELAERDCDVVVVPHHTTADQIRRLAPDGVLLSSGPGNPQDAPQAIQTIRELIGEFPLFGISLGHQLFALACGASTERMKFGHHGSNFPVRDVATGRCYITTQNHDYTVQPESLASTELEVTHVNNNDHSIAGLRHRQAAAFSIQYDPEAFPGMSESGSPLDRFLEQVRQFKLDHPRTASQVLMHASRQVQEIVLK